MISSADTQAPLVMVHLNVALLPAARPVTVVVGEDAVVMDTVPLTIDQLPVPVVGLFAAIVNDPLLHCAISVSYTHLTLPTKA